MKQTLLDMTQAILSAMDSDQVNSIDDTVESAQVALLIKNVYYDLIVDLGLPEHETMFQLLASGDNTKPCLMTVPEDITRIRSIRYNKKADADTYPEYEELTYKPFVDFIEDQQALREDTTGVGSQQVTFDSLDFEFIYKTDTDPLYFTMVDDHTIIFDGFDNTKDTTLQKSKTMCTGVKLPSWTVEDTFIPDLDPQQFPYLLNRAKVRAFNELKQQENNEATGSARRQKIISQTRRRKTPDQHTFEKVQSKYGRK